MEGGRGGTCACCPKMRPPYPWRFCHGCPRESGRREQRRAPRRHQPRHSPRPKAAACVHLRRRCSPRISAATTAGPHGTEFGCGRCHEHKGAERCIQGSALLEGSWLEAAPHPSCRRDRGRRRRPCSRRPCIESHSAGKANHVGPHHSPQQCLARSRPTTRSARPTSRRPTTPVRESLWDRAMSAGSR